jgi:hypothetical protein
VLRALLPAIRTTLASAALPSSLFACSPGGRCLHRWGLVRQRFMTRRAYLPFCLGILTDLRGWRIPFHLVLSPAGASLAFFFASRGLAAAFFLLPLCLLSSSFPAFAARTERRPFNATVQRQAA